MISQRFTFFSYGAFMCWLCAGVIGVALYYSGCWDSGYRANTPRTSQQTLVRGVGFKSIAPKEISDIVDNAALAHYKTLGKGFSLFAFGMQADTEIIKDDTDNIVATSIASKDSVQSSYELDGVEVVTSYSPARDSNLKNNTSKSDSLKNKTLSAKTDPQNIKQLITLKNSSNENKTLTFRTKSYINSNSIIWDGKEYELNQTPQSFKAYSKTSSVPEFAQATGTSDLKGIEQFKNYTHTYTTGATIQFESNEGRGMFDWSDVQGWNHEVLAYVDEDNKSVLELVLYDLNVPANGELVIDPVYGFDDSRTYDAAFFGDAPLQEVCNGTILIGDVNGDSILDLVIGVPKADYNGTDSGSVFVIFGVVNDSTKNQALSLSANYNIRYDGGAAGDELTVSAIGDVNGDGLSDLVLGAYQADNNEADSGSAYVIFSTLIDNVGATTGNNKPLSTATNYNIRYDGGAALDSLTINGTIQIGDVNGDGLSDLVLGAYGADHNGADSGSAYVIFSTLIDDVGATTGNNKPLSTATNYNIRYDGGAASDFLTSDGAMQIGDVNGDGLSDLILGTDQADNNGTASGSAWVMFSTLIDDVSTTTGNNKPLSTATNYNIRYDGGAASDFLTSDGAMRIGDVNGDGLSDLILGADQADNNGTASGSAWVMFSTLIDDVSTTTGNNKPLSTATNYNIRYAGGAASDYLTSSGAMRIGDVNGDGLSDLVLGAYGADNNGTFSGSAWVMFSTLIDDVSATTGNNKPLSTATNYNIRYDGGAAGNWLTVLSAMRIGDVNGDGLSDLVLWAYGADNNGSDSGSTWIMFSTLIDDVGVTTGNNKPLSTATNYNIRYDGGASSDYLTVGAIGDVNGDGLSDLVLGAYGADNNGTTSGSAWVIFSTLIDDVSATTGNNKPLSTATNYNIRYDGSSFLPTLTAENAIALGDINGDGIDDLVIGSLNASYNGALSGSAFVIFGNIVSTSQDGTLSTSTNYNIRYDGGAANDLLTSGGAIQIGDVNGDGLSDLVLGANQADNNGSNSGAAWVMFSTLIDDVGATTGNNKPLSTATNYNIRYDGGAAGNYLTRDGAMRIGDVNGDGLSDLVLGVYINSGSAWVMFSTLIDDVGATTGNNKPLSTATNYNIRYDGGAANDYLTRYGAIQIGDVNGDGLSDLVLGANQADNNGTDSGSAWVMFSTLIDDVGATTGNNKPLSTATNYNIRYDGSIITDYLTRGNTIQIGDINGDGLSDLVLGADQADNNGTDSGAAWVMFSTLIDDVGATTGNNKPLSTATNYNIRYAGDTNGYYLTLDGAMRIGDVNGDGLSDLVLGTYGADNNGTDSGSAWIMFSTLIDDVGATTGNNKPLSTATNYNIRYAGGAAGDSLTQFGTIRIGDVNGDGLSDLVLGAAGADNNGSASGSAYVIYSTLVDDVGDTTGNNKPLSSDTNYNIRFDGGRDGDQLTKTGIHLGGDLNNDGTTDLVLSTDTAFGEDHVSGAAYVIYGESFAYSLSGTITAGGSPLSGVSIDAGGIGSGTTDGSGSYSFSGIDKLTTYTLTPSLTNYTFSPTSATGDITENTTHNFTGTLNTYTISGTITDGTNPLASVTVNGGALGNTTTASDGTYSFASIPHGTSYTLTISKTGYTFTTNSASGTLTDATTHNFTGTLNTYTISGTITDGTNPLASVTVNGGALGNTITASDGTYSFASIPHGASYTLTISKTGYTFATNSASGTLTDATTHNFTGALNTYTISGTVTDGTNPLASVTINGGALGNTATATNGTYSFTGVPYGTSYTITPYLTDYTMQPESASGTVTDNTTVSFVATQIPEDVTQITGTVLQNGIGIEDAKIELIINSESYVTTSDANGAFSIVDVLAGDGHISAQKQGMTLAHQDMTIESGETTEVTLQVENPNLENPVYTFWNGFLDLINILELLNTSDSDINVTITLRDIDGAQSASTAIRIKAQSARDIVLNDIVGFSKDSYGIVEILTNNLNNEHNNPIDGRITSYRPALIPTATNEYDFVFSLALINAHIGTTHAIFNTINPSKSSYDAEHAMPNWLSIANLSDITQTFTIRYRTQTGTEIESATISIPAYGERDVQAGHELVSGAAVGLISVEPVDMTAPYLAQLRRFPLSAYYGNSSAPNYGFGVMTRHGNESRLVVPIGESGTNASDADTLSMDVLELVNTSASENSVDLRLYNQNGESLLQTTKVLSAYAQEHIVLESLPSNTLCTFIIDSTNPIIAGAASYDYNSATREIAVAHYIEALQPFGLTLSGTINTYIGIQNWLKLLNTTSAPIEVSISYQNANTETLTIPSYGRTDRLVSINDSNSYGSCTLTTLHAGSLSASITRIRPLNGVSDFTVGHVGR